MMRAASAAETLARRATQCSFSSAFHIRGAEARGFSSAVEGAYLYLIAPPVVVLGAAVLWRFVR